MEEVETDDLAEGAPGGDAPNETSDTAEGGAPRRRRRRRRRGRGRGEGASAQADGTAQASAQPTAQPTPSIVKHEHRDRGPKPSRNDASFDDPRAHDPSPRPPSRDAAAFASLSAGLFSHLDDREVSCKVEGCARTWTWTAAEQIQSFGQPPPKRMCAEHYAAFHTVADREIPCQNPWCERTWTWTKSAQLSLLSRERSGSIEPPTRTCDACAKQERDLADAEVGCRVEGCRRTWTWTREAQLKHRMWLRHAGAREAEGGDEPEGRRRRRHRRGRASEGPPPRMCEPCRQRQAKIVERETTCRVHGCTRTVTIDREAQLRAWAALGTDDVSAEVALPKRMCEVCREFCRLHADREVPCGRPGCDRSWTFKTGAQLQAFLAGRFEDPLRLCGHCLEAGHLRAQTDGHADVIEGAEIMPCIVPLCDGIWHYVPSMSIAPCDDGDLPLDRMCDRCRVERGASARREELMASAVQDEHVEPTTDDSSTNGIEHAIEADADRSAVDHVD